MSRIFDPLASFDPVRSTWWDGLADWERGQRESIDPTPLAPLEALQLLEHMLRRRDRGTRRLFSESTVETRPLSADDAEALLEELLG